MKIVRFSIGQQARVGVISGSGVVDLTLTKCRFQTLNAIIAEGHAATDELASIAAHTAAHYLVEDCRLLAAVQPSKYLAIGMNYAKHADEAQKLGVKKPTSQFWFNKQISCLSGPTDDIDPGVTQQLDYEVELGVVIGKSAKHVSVERAKEHIFGYVVANDISARDWQFHSPTFTVGKSFDTHGPVGPWIVTADEISDCHSLNLRCYVNGELRQSSNTANMIFNVYDQIAYLSTAFTLAPGDLLATGTPEGVGIARTPPTFLQVGDVVRCEIDAIGSIENRVVVPNGTQY
jgi:2-keto-4-pentenoate hydratase/2-oxohepta-3-ene-1,7-dioic acid hydratase in catechol pathway